MNAVTTPAPVRVFRALNRAGNGQYRRARGRRLTASGVVIYCVEVFGLGEVGLGDIGWASGLVDLTGKTRRERAHE